MSDHEENSTHVSDLPEHDCPTEIASPNAPSTSPELDQTVPSPAGFMDGARMLPEIEGYEVLEEIGRGGMGAVYRARQRAAGGRVVALKVMLGEAFASSAELRRFEREVEIASDLNHANIAHIYDSGLVQGRHYFAMEYVEGQALDTFCKTRDLPVKGRLRLFAAVCEAVAYAHRRGVIHRDLKPSNILVDNEGVPHVLDFGLAKTQSVAGEVAASRPDLTMDGMLLGTLPYMAPEQAEGKASAVDTRTDVYALGVILYELLTGKYPYEVTGQMVDVLQRIAEAEPKRPSTINRLIGDEVETIILRALHKVPDRRYSGADDFARDVTHFLAGEPIEAKRDSGLYVLRKTLRRYRVPVAFAAAIGLLLAASAVTSFHLYRRAETQRKVAESARIEEKRQREMAQSSEKKAEASRQEALENAKESARRLARQHFNTGTSKWLDQQDPASAAAYFTEALSVSPEEYPAARMILNNALKECTRIAFPPMNVTIKLSGGFQGYKRFQRPLISPDRLKVVTTSEGPTVWDITARKPIHEFKTLERANEYCSDGERIVTTAPDGAARIWDARTGQQTVPPLQDTTSIIKAAFSPDGKFLATVSAANTARVWDATVGKPISPPVQHKDRILHIAFSPDGRRVLTASKDGTAKVWDANTGQMVFDPLVQTNVNYLNAAVISPDGRWILTERTGSGPIMKSISVWDVTNRQPFSSPVWALEQGQFAAFSPDSKKMVTKWGLVDNDFAQIWDMATGRSVSPSLQHGKYVNQVTFSPDGRRIATASDDKAARIWDADSGQLLSPPIRHGASVLQAAFSPDGRRLVTTSADNAIRSWDLPVNQPKAHLLHSGATSWLAVFSPDRTKMVIAASDKTTQVWDINTGQPVSQPIKHNTDIYRVTFSPDGRWIAMSSRDNLVGVWDARTGQLVATPIQHDKFIADLSLSNDGKLVVVTVSGNRLAMEGCLTYIWDVQTGCPLSVPDGLKSSVTAVAFSPNGKSMVSLSRDSASRVWDTTTGKPVSVPLSNESRIYHANFSPDGKWIVTVSADLTRVWDASTGQAVSALMPTGDAVHKAIFSPDGRRIVTVSEDRCARVWDAATGKPVSVPMQGDGAGSLIASFSPDGRWIATATRDKAARIWDASTGQPLSASRQSGSRVIAIGFSPDGKRVLTVLESGELDELLIDVDLDEPVQLAQARVRAQLGVAVAPSGDVQPLTPEELAAAWHDYQRLQADYERAHPEKAKQPSETGVWTTTKSQQTQPEKQAPIATQPMRPLPPGLVRAGSPNSPIAVSGNPLSQAPSQADYTFTTRNGEVTITKYNGPGGDVVILDKINGLSVTGIGAKAFESCTNLTRVTISSGVTNIGANAFHHCINLAQVSLPDGLVCIGNNSFACCFALSRIDLPKTITTVGETPFANCDRLCSITVDPASATYESVNGVLFDKGMNSLILFPDGKARSYEIPDGITKIGPTAFKNCSNLTRVTIPQSVKFIEGHAFCWCKNLTEIYFRGDAPRLCEEVIHDSPKAVIYYPPTAKGWGPTFGGRPTAVWKEAGTGKPTANSLQPPSLSATQPTANSLQPPNVQPTAALSETSIHDFACVAENGGVAIAKYTGEGGAVVIPSKVNGLPVMSIKDNAFQDSLNVTNVVIPYGVTKIGMRAFCGCTNLTTITIPSSVTKISFAAFSGCTSLTAVKIPNGVTEIGQLAFCRCTGLTDMTIPASVKSIGTGAFAGCTALKELYFEGDTPDAIQAGVSIFGINSNTTVYYRPGTKGWGPTFGGRPTAVWKQ